MAQPLSRTRFLGTIQLATILVVAAGFRAAMLGRWCLWYDEVVTMTVARQPGVGEVIRTLGRLDASRAPLHPLLLHAWLGILGVGEVAGRSFSVLCGVLTVAAMFGLGRALFDTWTGVWAAWLGAICPLMVQYSRETRMYALLVLLTTLACWLLVLVRNAPGKLSWCGYGATLIALSYCHPLGLLMAGTLGAVALFTSRNFLAWLILHSLVGVAVAPWIGRYLDHPPEFVEGLLPLPFLLGVPIGFVGGDFRVMAGCLIVIANGMMSWRREKPRLDRPDSTLILMAWLIGPPVFLYVYSRFGHTIFGPSRYTLDVAPAYLVLLARGLRKLPWPIGFMLGAALSTLMIGTVLATSFEPDQRADWRAAATFLSREFPGDPVAVLSHNPRTNLETITATYYLGSEVVVVAVQDGKLLNPPEFPRTRIWVGQGHRAGMPIIAWPPSLEDFRPTSRICEFPGLWLREYKK